MANLGTFEIVIIAVLIIVLFGAKKLPEAARSLGRSMRILKSEVQEMSNDDAQQKQSELTQQPQPNYPPATQPQVDAQNYAARQPHQPAPGYQPQPQVYRQPEYPPQQHFQDPNQTPGNAQQQP